MAAPFTSDPDEVANRWQPLTPAQEALATQLLEDAENLLIARFPTIPARVTAGTLAAALVVQAQAAMVIRVLQNPEGFLEEAVDDWRGRRDSALSAGLLYIADSDAALLLPTRPRARSVVLRTHSTPTT